MVSFVRAAYPNDYQIIATLADEIWREHYTPVIGSSQVEYMLDRFQSPGRSHSKSLRGFVYYRIRYELPNPSLEEFPDIGYLAIQSRESGIFLSKFYVQNRFRGQGIGRTAMEFVEQMARDGHVHTITLTVNKTNYSAIKFYEKLGFQRLRALVQDIGNGFVMDDYEMQKVID
ncbi:MAG: N-acetyltransferase [Oscillatoriales cyanobacterium RM1_1_9]|nr:N-acetyltransferase [Oscillatoriales cyanobacterium RM1_1_9]